MKQQKGEKKFSMRHQGVWAAWYFGVLVALNTILAAALFSSLPSPIEEMDALTNAVKMGTAGMTLGGAAR